MISEKVFNTLSCLTQKSKKLYLKRAVEHEEFDKLKRIGLDGWSPEDRKASYMDVVLPYWKKFGLTPKKSWFEYYGSRDHRMDPRFVPADLYYTEIAPYLNDGLQRIGLANKAYYDLIFDDVKQPETVVVKTEGSYCDENRKLLTEEKAASLCLGREADLVFKKTVDSKKGKGISVIPRSECTRENILKCLSEGGPSFIVQEKIKQHPAFDALNPDSVCTIRVLSLLLDDNVYIESPIFRIGTPGIPYLRVHDEYLIEILDDGKLYPKIYYDRGKWYENGNGLFDDSFVIPSIDKVYDEVKRIHPRMGHFKWIGWDFTVDSEGDPVMIEYNVFPAPGPQIARCKPFFGEHSDWVYEEFFKRREWEKNHRHDVLIP